MRYALILALACANVGTAAFAQHEGHSDHSEPKHAQPVDREQVDHSEMDHGHQHSQNAAEPKMLARPPDSAGSGPPRAADAIWGADAMQDSRAALAREHGGMQLLWVQGDRLELRTREGRDRFLWDLQGWYGGDRDKLWVKTEGASTTSSTKEGDAELQLLYSRMISPFWDAQFGVRHDLKFGPGPNLNRTYAVVGLQGLAPYWFEVESALFVSEKGDVSARFQGTYDLLFTQKLIAQGRFETSAALQDDPEFDVGSGFNNVGVGISLRYECTQGFAPYVGVSWNRSLGNTADLIRAKGNNIDDTSVNFGIRMRF